MFCLIGCLRCCFLLTRVIFVIPLFLYIVLGLLLDFSGPTLLVSWPCFKKRPSEGIMGLRTSGDFWPSLGPFGSFRGMVSFF